MDSTSIASAGYDVRSRTMEIEFRNGGIYRYRDVPRELFNGLMSAGSKGRYFIERIRGKFEYERAR
ncbi:MAG: KTSC domain-containing protein [Chthoniobacteraceae bacterium]